MIIPQLAITMIQCELTDGGNMGNFSMWGVANHEKNLGDTCRPCLWMDPCGSKNVHVTKWPRDQYCRLFSGRLCCACISSQQNYQRLPRRCCDYFRAVVQVTMAREKRSSDTNKSLT